jgi:hypothetical protein
MNATTDDEGQYRLDALNSRRYAVQDARNDNGRYRAAMRLKKRKNDHLEKSNQTVMIWNAI